MGAPEPLGPPMSAIGNLGPALVSHLRRRLELLAVEITEEELRFARALGWQLLALFLACLTTSVGVALVMATFWDTPHRVGAIAWTLAVCALASIGAWWIHRRSLLDRPIVFSQTIEELRRDAGALTPRGPETQP